MAEGMSKFLEEELLKGSVGFAAFAAKREKSWLALCQAEVHPGETGTEIESQSAGKAKEFVSGSSLYKGYARKEIVHTEWEFSGENPVTMVNSGLVAFKAWEAGTVKGLYVALCTAATAGEVLFYGSVPEFEVSAVAPEFAAKAIKITLK